MALLITELSQHNFCQQSLLCPASQAVGSASARDSAHGLLSSKEEQFLVKDDVISSHVQLLVSPKFHGGRTLGHLPRCPSPMHGRAVWLEVWGL